MLRPVNEKFTAALDYNTYPFVEKSSLNKSPVVKNVPRWALRLHSQMMAQIFGPIDPISVKELFHTLKMLCDNNGTHEGAAGQLLSCLMRHLAAVSLKPCLSLKSKLLDYYVKIGVMTAYRQVVYHVLQGQATYYITAETKSEIATVTSNLPCLHWTLGMSSGSRHLDLHTLMTSMSERGSSLKDYCRSLGLSLSVLELLNDCSFAKLGKSCHIADEPARSSACRAATSGVHKQLTQAENSSNKSSPRNV